MKHIVRLLDCICEKRAQHIEKFYTVCNSVLSLCRYLYSANPLSLCVGERETKWAGGGQKVDKIMMFLQRELNCVPVCFDSIFKIDSCSRQLEITITLTFFSFITYSHDGLRNTDFSVSSSAGQIKRLHIVGACYKCQKKVGGASTNIDQSFFSVKI